MKETIKINEVLPEREQAILDTALLESDQLLARSLHDDQRRRRRRTWLLASVLGGVVMSVLILAFLLGWFTLTVPVSAETEKEASEPVAAKVVEKPSKTVMAESPGSIEVTIAPSKNVVECLEDLRRTVVCYDLSFDQVMSDSLPAYDEGRLELFPTADSWPDMLGHIVRDPSTYQAVDAEESGQIKSESGGLMFDEPLVKPIRVDGNSQALVFLDGIAKGGSVLIDTYATLYCQGDMAGVINSQSYSTTVIRGDVSGRMRNASYGHWVIFGNFSGRYDLESYGTLRIFGEFKGDIKLKSRAKVFLAGHTSETALKRISGAGTVYLEKSSLKDGQHSIGKLNVIVGKNRVTAMPKTANRPDDFKRAWQMFFGRKYTTSERLFRRVLKAEPENPHAMNGLGWSLRNQGKFADAKPLLQQAIKLAPDHWGAISGLATCYHDEGNVDKAVKLWERVAENAEGANDATVSLAEIYLERGQYEESVECYEKLVVWFPEQKAFTELLSKAKEGLAKKTK